MIRPMSDLLTSLSLDRPRMSIRRSAPKHSASLLGERGNDDDTLSGESLDSLNRLLDRRQAKQAKSTASKRRIAAVLQGAGNDDETMQGVDVSHLDFEVEPITGNEDETIQGLDISSLDLRMDPDPDPLPDLDVEDLLPFDEFDDGGEVDDEDDDIIDIDFVLLDDE